MPRNKCEYRSLVTLTFYFKLLSKLIVWQRIIKPFPASLDQFKGSRNYSITFIKSRSFSHDRMIYVKEGIKPRRYGEEIRMKKRRQKAEGRRQKGKKMSEPLIPMIK